MLEGLRGYSDLVSKLIVEELYRNDISTFAVSPGGRLIPVLEAIKQHPRAQVKLFNDERSAAFWAQGHSKITGTPVVLLVTSGTAVANLLPGVIEAYQSGNPLILLTCDRPWELQYARANQTINQKNVFQDYVKHQVDLPAIEGDLQTESLLANIDHLAAAAITAPAGPVHINIAFRKPYHDKDFSLDAVDSEQVSLLDRWYQSKQAFRSVVKTRPVPTSDEIESIKASINQSKRPLIVAGPQKSTNAQAAICELADKLKAPIVADINSGLRQGRSACLYNYYIHKAKGLDTDLILYFGDRIVSERLREFINSQDTQMFLFNNYSFRQDAIENELLPVTKHIFCEPAQIAKTLSYSIDQKDSTDYLDQFCNYEEQAKAHLENEFGNNLTEASAINFICNNTKEQTLIYHSSSLLFRELEYFVGNLPARSILSNRGVVGIDGVIASALGACNAKQQKTYLLIGDQAFMHDLNSLAIAANNDLHIFIINNQGGAVFNLLDHQAIMDDLVNSQSVDFEKAVSAYGLDYCKVYQAEELATRMNQINSTASCTVTEVCFDGTDTSNFFKNFEI